MRPRLPNWKIRGDNFCWDFWLSQTNFVNLVRTGRKASPMSNEMTQSRLLFQLLHARVCSRQHIKIFTCIPCFHGSLEPNPLQFIDYKAPCKKPQQVWTLLANIGSHWPTMLRPFARTGLKRFDRFQLPTNRQQHATWCANARNMQHPKKLRPFARGLRSIFQLFWA